MRKEQKAQEINEIAEILSQYNTVYVADLTGMTVEKTNTVIIVIVSAVAVATLLLVLLIFAKII